MGTMLKTYRASEILPQKAVPAAINAPATILFENVFIQRLESR